MGFLILGKMKDFHWLQGLPTISDREGSKSTSWTISVAVTGIDFIDV